VTASVSQAVIIERLCGLQVEVAEQVIGWQEPSDCFCENSDLKRYENSGAAVAFIEAAVREKIATRAAATAPPLSPAEQTVVDRFESAPDPYREPRGRQASHETPAEACRRLGWTVGTRLEGDEGYGSTVIRITAIGESEILVRAELHELNWRESGWVLFCRDWQVVP